MCHSEWLWELIAYCLYRPLIGFRDPKELIQALDRLIVESKLTVTELGPSQR